ncbi:MAG: hypothetical protein K2Q03_07070 [Sphingobacteriaceae bacterium]|nr:hypothetical protein [Sphingobacteriaceae bacterium]
MIKSGLFDVAIKNDPLAVLMVCRAGTVANILSLSYTVAHKLTTNPQIHAANLRISTQKGMLCEGLFLKSTI